MKKSIIIMFMVIFLVPCPRGTNGADGKIAASDNKGNAIQANQQKEKTSPRRKVLAYDSIACKKLRDTYPNKSACEIACYGPGTGFHRNSCIRKCGFCFDE